MDNRILGWLLKLFAVAFIPLMGLGLYLVYDISWEIHTLGSMLAFSLFMFLYPGMLFLLGMSGFAYLMHGEVVIPKFKFSWAGKTAIAFAIIAIAVLVTTAFGIF